MKVQIRDHSYLVRWYYECDEKPTGVFIDTKLKDGSIVKKEIIEKTNRKTTCEISLITKEEMVEKEGKKKWEYEISPLSIRSLTCYFKDHYRKEKGRKETLKLALNGIAFTKPERSAFWDAFRQMTKQPKWYLKTKKDKKHGTLESIEA